MGVLVAHSIIFRTPMWWWDQLVARPSWSGVDLFFVISGFLISGLLFSEFQKKGRINFARFAIRRALKLYPTLYALVLGIMVWRLWKYGFQGWIFTPVVHDILFVQNYLRGTYPHFWSLAVEEHFYVMLPLTLYVMIRWGPRGDSNPFCKLPLVFLVIASATLLARILNGLFGPSYSVATHQFPTHLRIDSLSFGVLLSYWYRFHFKEFSSLLGRARRYLVPVSVLLILPAVFLPPSNFFLYTFGFTGLYLGYGGLMIALLQLTMPTKGFGGWMIRSFAYIGQHSYPIYVFHLFILESLMRTSLLKGPGALPVYFFCTVTAGILFSKLIEFPVLHFRDRIFPPETSAQVIAEGPLRAPVSVALRVPVAAAQASTN